MNILIAQTVEKRLIEHLENYMKQNPITSSSDKMLCTAYIFDKIKDYKKSLLLEKDTLGLSEEEINKTMQYVELKILMKFQEI